MGGLQELSAAVKISWVMLTIAAILDIVAIASPRWVVVLSDSYVFSRVGLWKACLLTGRGDGDGDEEEDENCGNTKNLINYHRSSLPILPAGWVQGTQALCGVALSFLLLAAVILDCYMFLSSVRGSRGTIYVSMLATFVSGVLMNLGVFIFGIRVKMDIHGSSLHWGYWVCAAGSEFTMFASLFLFVEFTQLQTSRKTSLHYSVRNPGRVLVPPPPAPGNSDTEMSERRPSSHDTY